jgi:hypothetical protein
MWQTYVSIILQYNLLHFSALLRYFQRKNFNTRMRIHLR